LRLIDVKALPVEHIKDKKGLYHQIAVDGKSDARNFEIIFSRMEKGGIGFLHDHPHSEHFLYVLDGKLVIKNNVESHEVTPGKGLLLLAGEPHEVHNVHDGDTHYFVVYAPPR